MHVAQPADLAADAARFEQLAVLVPRHDGAGMTNEPAALPNRQHRHLPPASPRPRRNDPDIEHDAVARSLVVDVRGEYLASAPAEPAKIHAAAVQ